MPRPQAYTISKGDRLMFREAKMADPGCSRKEKGSGPVTLDNRTYGTVIDPSTLYEQGTCLNSLSFRCYHSADQDLFHHDPPWSISSGGLEVKDKAWTIDTDATEGTLGTAHFLNSTNTHHIMLSPPNVRSVLFKLDHSAHKAPWHWSESSDVLLSHMEYKGTVLEEGLWVKLKFDAVLWLSGTSISTSIF